MQAGHAAIESALYFKHFDPHPHLIYLTVPIEWDLKEASKHLQELGIAVREWREPDRNNELTAIGTEPIRGSMRQHLRKYPLMKGIQTFPALEEETPAEKEWGWSKRRMRIRQMVKEFSKD